MKKKIDVYNLKIGMYVTQLDRPWLETPFLFQGFMVDSESVLADVQRICEYVYIDLEKSNDIDELPRLGLIESVPAPKRTRTYESTISLEDEMEVAPAIRQTTRDCVDNVFNAITSDKPLNLPDIKQTVKNMVDSIVRNQNAQMCLTQLKNRDEYTAQHSVNVCVLTITFCRHLGMSETSLNLIGLGALLHDIGKLKTPLDVLNKPGKLTDEEFKVMKSHPEQGKKYLLETQGIPASVIDIAFSHHERLAGHGYPRGLTAEEISPWSKIVAITDVYDAITSDRCYHDGMSPTQALTKMYGWRLKDFDPELLEQFIQCIGIYPIGALVELTTGEVGIVISVTDESRLRPKILLILDDQKNPYFPKRIINLAIYNLDEHEHVYGIKDVLEPGAYNINIGEYMQEIQQAQLVNVKG